MKNKPKPIKADAVKLKPKTPKRLPPAISDKDIKDLIGKAMSKVQPHDEDETMFDDDHIKD